MVPPKSERSESGGIVLLLAFFAACYSVVQVMLLTLPARSTSWREAAGAFAIGLSSALALTLAIEYALADYMGGNDPSIFMNAVRANSYGADPILEEAIKILPLALLLLFPTIRQRLNMTDMVVIAAATGAGFGLAEASLSIATGMTAGEPFGRYVDGVYQFSFAGGGTNNLGIPAPWFTLATWLPAGLFNVPAFQDPYAVNVHVAYSVFAGAGLAIIVRAPKFAWLGIALLFYSALAHAGLNANILSAELPLGLSTITDATRLYDGLFAFAAMVGVGLADRLRLKKALSAHSAVQVGGGGRLARLSIINATKLRGLRALWTFVLERRAYLNAAGVRAIGDRHGAVAHRVEALAASLRGEDRGQDAKALDTTPPSRNGARLALFGLSLLIALPALPFAALVGWEDVLDSWLYDEARPSTQTAWLALVYTRPLVLKVLLVLLAIGVVMQIGGAVMHTRRFWDRRVDQIAHARLEHGFGLLATLGGAAIGVAALYVTFETEPLALMHAHALERWLNANPLAAILLAIAAAVLTVMIPMAVATFLPRLSAIMGIIQALTGIDAATGQKLTFLERALGLLPGEKSKRQSIEDFKLAVGTKQQAHLAELSKNNVKFTPDNVISTARNANGQIIFLEKGNSQAGLIHIMDRHANDFIKVGVSPNEIPSTIIKSVLEGKIVGYQGRGIGRPIYEASINGKVQKIAVTISENGFIVGANPVGR